MPRHKLGNAIRVGDGLFPATKFEICAGMNKNNQLKTISVLSVWFLILNKKQVFEFLVLIFLKSCIQIPFNCCFLMLSPPSVTVTPSGVLEGHHQESILSLICWSVVFEGCCLTKKSFWNAPLPKFGVFLHTHLQPLFHIPL